jgi:hypothetical protein
LDYTLIFDIHIIFQPFRSFIHVIYKQNFIIHLQMDPGDQLYTIDELRCWKVDNLTQFLTMRGLTKEELAALCFSACKLNLPLVPSQDEVLKDNKRCHDNILSECGISNPLQIYSGWLDEHDHGMQFLATNLFDRHYAVLVSPW